MIFARPVGRAYRLNFHSPSLLVLEARIYGFTGGLGSQATLSLALGRTALCGYKGVRAYACSGRKGKKVK